MQKSFSFQGEVKFISAAGQSISCRICLPATAQVRFYWSWTRFFPVGLLRFEFLMN